MIAKYIKNLRKRFKQNRGATAVEFAMLAAPFMFLVFAIMEIMVIFFIQTTLEASVAVESRKIRTGQSQTMGITQSQFKNNVCARLYGLGDCASRLFVMVNSYTTAPTALTNPWADGTLTTGSSDDEPYQASNAGDIVLVRSYYVWPLMTPMMSSALNNFSGGSYGAHNRIIVATTAFKNEPYN